MPRKKSWSRATASADADYRIRHVVEASMEIEPTEVPEEEHFDYTADIGEQVVLDEAKLKDYAFKLIADEIGLSDIPIDYQDAVKDESLRILKGE